MKKILFSIGLLASSLGFSQSYVGYLSDNYSGVHAVINNPANIVDSRFRTDINLFGVSAFLGNDAASFKFSDLNDIINGSDNIENKIKYSITNSNNLITNLDVLGPSFMFNIKPNHSVALFSRVRTFMNVDKIDGNSIKYILDNRSNINLDEEKNFSLKNAEINSHVWGEIGLSYATILMNKGEHFVKGGLSLKYLMGGVAESAYVRNASVDIKPNSTTTSDDDEVITSGDLSISESETFKNLRDSNYEFDTDASGFGFDIGFTYEWRPELDKYSYTDAKDKKAYYRDVNKYKLKAGLSLTDVGSVNYKGMKSTLDLKGTINKTNWETRPKNGSYTDMLEHFFTAKEKNTKEFSSSLPMALHFNADWNINDKFYVNLDTNFDIAGEGSVSIENTYSLTPRYETKWFSAYIPLSLREFSGFNAGFGLRAGPLYIGSGSILTNLLGTSKSADVYVGLKIPIYQSRPKDADGDGIFNKEDKCPNEAGPKENNGCPWGDKDNDAITDNIDKCPEVAGPKENDGCPWGDKDNDGVKDNVDKCPEVAGLTEFNGCPDTDGDKVPDNLDKCPKVAGDVNNNGCPRDTDGDGIADAEDKCPTEAGPKDNNGCPKKVVTKEAKKTIDKYAKSIYFNSGKATFRPGVTEMLDMIVEVLKEYKDSKFSIEGHTDSQGSEVTNQKLSERRAKAVLNYLVQKGIDASRLTSHGFGELYPIDTNKTRAGRATNRRVEIKLQK